MTIKAQSRMINFLIDHIDPKGQGVFKKDDQVYFIPKTLTGESGQAEIYRSKKNLHFAMPVKIDSPSLKRTAAICSHFAECGACHFLHTNYAEEIRYKKLSLEFMTKKLYSLNIEVVEAKKRDSYRNRLQLHYDIEQKLMGLWSTEQDRLVKIPDCQIAHPKVAEKLKELYLNDSWIEILKAKKQVSQGHLELYYLNQKVHMALNQNYAHLGFTQIHEEMNLELQSLVQKEFHERINAPIQIYDLFGGNGNLSKGLAPNSTYVVDHYQEKIPQSQSLQEFISLDLYHKNAPRTLQSLNHHKTAKNFLLLDPPRSGLKNIDEFLSILDPELVFYVSCDPHTFVRDLAKVGTSYKLEKLYLLDLFPSTYHFESFGILKRV